MTTTPNLIDALVERAAPVRRLRAPLVRACLWLGFAGIVLALLAAVHGVRTDLVEHLRQPVFIVSLVAALATGILAAIAAFIISLPDRLLPAPAVAIWLSTIGYGCLSDWVSMDPLWGPLRRDSALLRHPTPHERAAGARNAGDAALCGAVAG
jgi:Negative regulator of sigma F